MYRARDQRLKRDVAIKVLTASFSADPDRLRRFFRTSERELPARMYRLDIATGRREVWKELMPGDLASNTQLTASAISGDGETVLFNYGRSLADLYLAEGLK